MGLLTQNDRISKPKPRSPVGIRTKTHWLTLGFRKPLVLGHFMKVAFCLSWLDLDPGVGSSARPVATGQAFGHHSFQSLTADLHEEGLAGSDHALREDQPWMHSRLGRTAGETMVGHSCLGRTSGG